MKKQYDSPDFTLTRFSFERLLEEDNDPLITSSDENMGNQGSEYNGDLGGN